MPYPPFSNQVPSAAKPRPYKGADFSPPVAAATASTQHFEISHLPRRRMAGAIGWDEDGQHTLYLLRLADHSAVSFQRGNVPYVAAVRTFWSPSGRYLLALCSYEGQPFVQANLDSGAIQEGSLLGPPGKPRRVWQIEGEPRWVGNTNVLGFTVDESCDPYQPDDDDAGCKGASAGRVPAVRQVDLDASTLLTRTLLTRATPAKPQAARPCHRTSAIAAASARRVACVRLVRQRRTL
jgi:hypothetical protein